MSDEQDKKEDVSSVRHMPDGKWAFDESVTQVFTDMLRRSIPQYETMRQSVFDIGRRYAVPDTHIVDLGCSRGDSLAPFVRGFGDRCRYLGLEVSPPMLEAARERFQDEIDSGLVSIEDSDLLDEYPSVTASVTLSVLTLQFTPVEERQRILDEIYQHTAPGGALILVEKVLGDSEDIDDLMVTLYHELKASHGYSAEEVERKRLALEGVLVPRTAAENEAMLRKAGFTRMDCFWRWMNFAGWLALR